MNTVATSVVRVVGRRLTIAADGLAEEQVGPLDRGVHGDDQSRDVDALADHVHGHQPAGPAGARRARTARSGVRAGLVADDDDRLLAR